MTDLPDYLIQYLAGQDRRRTRTAADWYTELTPREQQLVREAALMGWVQGRLSADRPVPKDAIILLEIIAAAQEMPDLYPGLSRRRPASLGLGHGPGDLSQREGFA